MMSKPTVTILLTIMRVVLGGSWLYEGVFKVQAQFSIAGLVHTIAQGDASPLWYEQFIVHIVGNAISIFNLLIPAGEVAVGLALITGIVPRVALLVAIFMGINYWLANMIYIYPLQLFVAVVLICTSPNTKRYTIATLLARIPYKRQLPNR
ncbi:DoxX family membrane protein [Kurthia sibirica]|nr:DoxX family membrane protein [Kurthia sibirica]GEK33550.1 hypothetical protein KSI01_10830 [Kurthia sibirica]